MDGRTALARRLYLHVENGGVVSALDLSRLVAGMEVKDIELDRLRARVAEMEECREALSEARSNWEEASGEIWRLEGVLRVQLEALCAALPYVEDAGVRADIDRVRDAIAFDREQRSA